MQMRRARQFVYGQTGWMLTTVFALSVLGELSIELFFTASLIGFLVITELTTPFNIRPEWRTRLKWIIFVGTAIFCYLVVRRVLEILPEGFI